MFNLSNKAYDRAKDLVTLVLPASATLYAALAGLWSWGYVLEVTGTCAAVATFLGVILKINTVQFAKTNTIVPDVTITALEQSPAGVTLSDLTNTCE